MSALRQAGALPWAVTLRGAVTRAGAVTAAVAAAAGLAACGSGSATKAASPTAKAGSTTLNMAFSFDPGSLDPDVFYGNEGLEVTTSCYEGLLRYQDNTTKIEPDLAESYTVSDDGKTYTFHLRPHVQFVDGTPLTASAIEFDIERRRNVEAGPAYMVDPIVSMQTPSPLTLVVNLKTPENPFTSWLASPYGLRAISPSLVRTHEEKKDLAQHWLADHCAGTGPYTLSQAVSDQRYVLSTNPHYWGAKPYFKTVVIRVIPSFSTQELELRSGGLDLMTHGVPNADINRFEGESGFQVVRLPGISAMNLWVNPHKPNLQNSEVRRAIGMALDRAKLVQEVYGDNAVVYNGMFAPDTLPSQYDYKVPYDPGQAKATMAKVPSSKRAITLVYTTDETDNQQMAGLIAQQLNSVGFEVHLRGLPETEVFEFPSDPPSKRPDMIVLPQNPDDASPSSFAQLQWLSKPGTGAFFPPFDPSADKIFEEATQSVSPEEATRLYGKAAEMYAATYALVPIANTKTVIVARKGITGFGVARQGLWTVDIPALHGS